MEIRMFHTCRQCGKKFYIGSMIDNWQYKRNSYCSKGEVENSTIWFCSWSCMSRFSREHDRIRKLDKELMNEK